VPPTTEAVEFWAIAAYSAALVVEDAFDDPDPDPVGDAGLRLETDPLSDRWPFHIDRQVGVDEQVFVPRERRAEAGAEVAGGGQALERRRRLVRDERPR
jgi:hypothetical protein